MKLTPFLYIVLAGSVITLLFALYRARWIYRQPVEDERLKTIGGYIADGAMAFMTREYRVLVPFVLIVAAFLAVGNRGPLRWQAAAFALGASCSALAGFIGMKVATASNSRTTSAAMKNMTEALKVSFSGGSVMGMSVVGLALFGIFLVMFASVRSFGIDPDDLSSFVLPLLASLSLV